MARPKACAPIRRSDCRCKANGSLKHQSSVAKSRRSRCDCRLHAPEPHHFSLELAARICAAGYGNLAYTGHYRQFLFDGRVDHKLRPNHNLMFRVNVDRFFDDNPQDAVGGTNAPSVARRYSRRSWTAQVNHTAVVYPRLLNEARFAYLHGDPVTLWEAQNLSTVCWCGFGLECDLGVCEHRSAADVSVAGPVYVLTNRRRVLKRQIGLERLVASGHVEPHHKPQNSHTQNDPKRGPQ